MYVLMEVGGGEAAARTSRAHGACAHLPAALFLPPVMPRRLLLFPACVERWVEVLAVTVQGTPPSTRYSSLFLPPILLRSSFLFVTPGDGCVLPHQRSRSSSLSFAGILMLVNLDGGRHLSFVSRSGARDSVL